MAVHCVKSSINRSSMAAQLTCRQHRTNAGLFVFYQRYSFSHCVCACSLALHSPFPPLGSHRARASHAVCCHHTNGTSIFLLGTLSPNSFRCATCFLTLHCAICAALTTRNSQLVSVDVNTQNTSQAASSHV